MPVIAATVSNPVRMAFDGPVKPNRDCLVDAWFGPLRVVDKELDWGSISGSSLPMELR